MFNIIYIYVYVENTNIFSYFLSLYFLGGSAATDTENNEGSRLSVV